jgi:hypothetical protein
MDLEIYAEKVHFEASFATIGRYTLRGQCNRFIVKSHGATEVLAADMIVQNAYVLHNSVGNISISPSAYLEYELLNQGNLLLFYGPDSIHVVSHTGKGEVFFEY